MRGTAVFAEAGVIVGVMAAGVFRVELPNGHRCVGYVPSRERGDWKQASIGDRVRIDFSPFDLSKGRVRQVERASV